MPRYSELTAFAEEAYGHLMATCAMNDAIREARDMGLASGLKSATVEDTQMQAVASVLPSSDVARNA